MITGTCHCGAVTFELERKPRWLTRCNCSFCVKANGLWAHEAIDKVSVTYDPENIVRYIWGAKTLTIITCKTCGCTTHWESLDPEAVTWMGVNCNMVDHAEIADVKIRNFDGRDSWAYLDEQ